MVNVLCAKAAVSKCIRCVLMTSCFSLFSKGDFLNFLLFFPDDKTLVQNLPQEFSKIYLFRVEKKEKKRMAVLFPLNLSTFTLKHESQYIH